MHQELDRLAAFDSDRIGCEFSSCATIQHTDRRQHEARRMQLMMDEWKTSLNDSQRIPKQALKNTCRFERRRLHTDALISLSLFVMLTGALGVACAYCITHLKL